MPLLAELIWITLVVTAVFGVWYCLRDQDWFPDNELYIALTAGFIGSLFFALVSPIFVPWGHHALAMFVVDSPEPTISTSYSDEMPPSISANNSADFDYYAVTLINQEDRPISSLSVQMDFPGCVDRKGAKSYSGLSPTNYDASWAPSSIVHFSRPFQSQGNLAQCDVGIYIETLPAHRMVTTYFVVDREPEETTFDFSGSDVQTGQVYVDYSYSWQYRSIRRFPDPSPQVLNATES